MLHAQTLSLVRTVIDHCPDTCPNLLHTSMREPFKCPATNLWENFGILSLDRHTSVKRLSGLLITSSHSNWILNYALWVQRCRILPMSNSGCAYEHHWSNEWLTHEVQTIFCANNVLMRVCYAKPLHGFPL
eukprot:960847-Amphidinium_carterae.2